MPEPAAIRRRGRTKSASNGRHGANGRAVAAGAPGRGGASEVPGAGARRRGLAGTSEYERRLCRLELELTGLRLRNEELQAIISQLEASRDDYASLFDTAPVGYVILDESGSVQRVNQHFALLLGHKPGWLLDGPFARLVAKADFHTFLEHFRESKHTPKRPPAELSLLP